MGTLGTAGSFDAGTLAGVTHVVVVELEECDESDIDAASSASLQSVIAGNAEIQAEITGQAGPGASVVGAMVNSDTLTVYVRS